MYLRLFFSLLESKQIHSFAIQKITLPYVLLNIILYSLSLPFLLLSTFTLLTSTIILHILQFSNKINPFFDKFPRSINIAIAFPDPVFRTPKLGTRLFYLHIFITHLVFSLYTFTLLSLLTLRKTFYISKRFYLHILFTHSRTTSFCPSYVSHIFSNARNTTNEIIHFLTISN